MSITRPVTRYFLERGYTALNHPTPFAEIFDGVPPLVDRGDNDVTYDPSYEIPDAWAPIPCHDDDSVPHVTRYVDGSANLSPLGWGLDGGGIVAIMGGKVGAMTGVIRNRRIVPEAEVVEEQFCRTLVAISHYGIDAAALSEIRGALAPSGIHLVDRRIDYPDSGEYLRGVSAAAVAAREAALAVMRDLETVAAAGGTTPPSEVTIVDGPLWPHLRDPARRTWPLIGVIKRHARSPLPDEVARCVLQLCVGERTPTMLIHRKEGSLASSYFKIAPDHGTLLNGVIRVEVTTEQVESRIGRANLTQWMSGLAARLRWSRCSRPEYARNDCSLHPIVLIEDRLHARQHCLRTPWRLKRLLGLLQ